MHLDERAFVARVEAAGADELLRIVAHPSVDEERTLRTHLGDARFSRLHSIALCRGPRTALGKVVVLHGVMGSELTAYDATGAADRVWVNALRLMGGGFARLRLREDGRSAADPSVNNVRPSGILKRHYGELVLGLSRHWQVRAFAYDWRKDVRIAAAELDAVISQFAADGETVHLVGHGMGGLVARAYVRAHPAQWRRAPKARLVLLGAPNHGSFLALRVLTGVDPIIGRLRRITGASTPAELMPILHSFPGLYQLLPSPVRRPEVAPIYRRESYEGIELSAMHLQEARAFHEWLAESVDPERIVNVLGYGHPTPDGVDDPTHISAQTAYAETTAGDGWVSLGLGTLDGVATAYVNEHHGALASNAKVLVALERLLAGGGDDAGSLSRTPPAAAELTSAPAMPGRAASDPRGNGSPVDTAAEDLILDRFLERARTRSGTSASPPYITAEERVAEEAVTSTVLGPVRGETRRGRRADAGIAPTRIEIRLRHGKIEEAHEPTYGDGAPVDAIAVGHYLGVKPVAAELALDRAISAALRRTAQADQPDKPAERLTDEELLVTQYSERGIIRGDLAQPFFLHDPRPSVAVGPERVIAIAGMGVPGRFGVPELTVLARELCWSLGVMRKCHLATVLIGSGAGNLPAQQAMGGWLRGIKHAITGARELERRHVTRVTFVEVDPRKILEMDDTICLVRDELQRRERLVIDYPTLSKDERAELVDRWHQREVKRADDEAAARRSRIAGGFDGARSDGGLGDRAPTRVTVELNGGKYRFGAIQETASIPEREIPLDPDLAERANNELAAEWDVERQLERGRFLERLLIPADLRNQLQTNAPLVLYLDAATARIHWEMVALSDPSGVAGDSEGEQYVADHFLGLGRGVTRQLRTLFAPPPEPPPPPRRVLRVLVVADPAEDARLPGAEIEGAEVVELFERANAIYEQQPGNDNRVEVVSLMGPFEATRTNVLRHLMLRHYDVLHFAGHATYDRQAPSASGWVFTGGQRLTANELQRIDRIPKFVFSNACESGVTPDRSERRSAELAPSFAESFFARGVANFVCTAWPVEDSAARQFAGTLYASLLGVPPLEPLSGDSPTAANSGAEADGPNAAAAAAPRSLVPQPMFAAMREARLAVNRTPAGARAWGAYQHYGKPYFRFFMPTRDGGGARPI